MTEFENLKAQKDEILRRERQVLARRVADACFGEGSSEQIARIEQVLESALKGALTHTGSLQEHIQPAPGAGEGLREGDK